MRADLPDSEKKKLDLNKVPKDEYKHLIRDLTSQMDMASKNLRFEEAAELRDMISEIAQVALQVLLLMSTIHQ